MPADERRSEQAMSETTGTTSEGTSSTVASAAHTVQETLARPMHAVTETVNHVPGVGMVKGVVGGVLDKVESVSPRTRRVAAYTGAGLLGAAGLIEWPVAAAGAAAVWLTQARRKNGQARQSGQTTATVTAEAPEAKAPVKPSKTTGPSKPAKTRASRHHHA